MVFSGSLSVNNKIIKISKLLEECGVSQPPCFTFTGYFYLVAATGLLQAVPIPAHWSFWGDLVSPVGDFIFIENEAS